MALHFLNRGDLQMAWRMKGDKTVQRKSKKEHDPKFLNTKWRYAGEKKPHNVKELPDLDNMNEKTVEGLEGIIQLLREKSNSLHKANIALEQDLKKAKDDDKKVIEKQLRSNRSKKSYNDKFVEKKEKELVSMKDKAAKLVEDKPVDEKPTDTISDKDRPSFLNS